MNGEGEGEGEGERGEGRGAYWNPTGVSSTLRRELLALLRPETALPGPRTPLMCEPACEGAYEPTCEPPKIRDESPSCDAPPAEAGRVGGRTPSGRLDEYAYPGA